MNFVLSLSFFSLFVFCSDIAVGKRLQSIAEVRALAPEDAALNHEVEIEAQLICMGPYRRGAFVYDGEHGIYVAMQGLPLEQIPKEMDTQRTIRIRGVSHPGDFISSITATQIRLGEKRPFPNPVKLDALNFNQPDLDCQWVSLEGVVLSVIKAENGGYVVATLRFQSQDVLVRFSDWPDVEEKVRDLVHRRVRIPAIATTKANKKRQMILRYFQASSIEGVEVLDQSSDLAFPINEVLRSKTNTLVKAKIKGTIFYRSGRVLYVKSSDGSFLVKMGKEEEWEVGTEIEAEGQVIAQPLGPEMLAYKIIKTGHQGEIEPIDLPVGGVSPPEGEPLFINFHNDFVSLSAKVVNVSTLDGVTTIQCESDGHFFDVYSPDEVGGVGSVSPGCLVSIVGILEMMTSPTTSSISRLNNYNGLRKFRIRLRNGDEISVIKKAAWWNAERLFQGLMALIVLTFVVLVWVFTLKRRVAHQTSVIKNQVELAASLKERQKLARDLHDTLQQNMIGISMQVETARNLVGENSSEKAASILERVQKMLTRCRKETRESISELRGATASRGSLALYVEESMQEQAQEAGVTLNIETTGEPVLLPPEVVRNSMFICREAFTNALKHAKAKNILLRFCYREDRIVMTITDDGLGFDPESPMEPGHYGVFGMKERASMIDAIIEIQSRKNKGTSISLEVILS